MVRGRGRAAVRRHDRLAQGRRLLIEPEPVGTCAAVTAWNFPVAYAEAPFGGVDHSGMGREGGHEAIRDYQNVKLTHMMWS